MALDQHELDKLNSIAEGVAAIDEHILAIDERMRHMDIETERRFNVVHERIYEVKNDLERDINNVRTEARGAGAKAGAILGGLGLALSILKDWLIRGGQ
jgi:hypothetical protein